MPFDKATRNALARLVGAARDRLIEDLTAQLQSEFRLQPDGTTLPLDGLTDAQRAAAEDLRELLAHYRATLPATERQPGKASFDRLVREIGFTVLNRLAALRLAEERGLVVQCVRQGMASEGFQLYERLANGALGTGYSSYRAFLYNLFDELAVDLGPLFDTRSPLSHVFPTERALQDVLDVLNTPDLSGIWREDETIGWIYQYYNDEAERKQMREASQAPRNSRELAVRNQFFTPRYVVEFLADNSLGRLWYEMRAGDTRLAEECRYLVKQPGNDGAASPTRPKKDPRSITMLDPAGGSGHFGLYCFDLFETIYAEAWDDPGLGPALRDDYADRIEYERAVPRLILAHNVHIIDIDPRAVQIAALALWLRAQRSYQRLGLKAADRPRITRMNVVVAEPMPGDHTLLDDFVTDLRPRVLGDLVRVVFDKMQLAGEAGSLLKIEVELTEAIASAKKQWQAGGQAEQLALLPDANHVPVAEQLALFNVSDISDERFWDQAEARVLEALSDYAEHAANGQVTRRTLFAQDAAQGFAFIELCRNRYDVVLMNPPFGLSLGGLYDYLNATYPDCFIDLLGAFVVRAQSLSSGGLVGAITSRACLYTKTLVEWRRKYVAGRVHVLADFGMGVLDGAMVRACAYVLPAPASDVTGVYMNLRRSAEKASDLEAEIAGANKGRGSNSRTFICSPELFGNIPQSRILYWLAPEFWERLRSLSSFEPEAGTVRAGLTTYDDPRFLRLRWEVPTGVIGVNRTWMPIAKGGYFGTFYADVHLVVNWFANGIEVGEHNRKLYGTDAQSRRGSKYYLRPALTYTRRTDYFSARLLPGNVFFSDKGPAILPEIEISPLYLAGLFNSNLFRALVHTQSQGGCFETGVLKLLPWTPPSAHGLLHIQDLAAQIWLQKLAIFTTLETDSFFRSPFLDSSTSLLDAYDRVVAHITRANQSVRDMAATISEVVESEYELSADDYEDLDVFDDDHDVKEVRELLGDSKPYSEMAISFLVGCGYGRWDIRSAVSANKPEFPNGPLDPIPACPPGMLIGPDGFPATMDHIVSEEWLLSRPNIFTLPPEGSVARPTIPDSEYPLRIDWDGILVDDPGLALEREDPHRSDIVRRVREALGVLWGERASATELEACEILGVRDLREYFRKPNNFFADHLKGYSKSRRQAPIYWPLSTASGDYTVWIYFHRLTGDTLFTIVNQYVKPKIEAVQARIEQIGQHLGEATGRAATALRDEIEDLRRCLGELNDFQAELLRVAALPYRPNLNDGVILNAAPLHKLFRLRKWAADCKSTWEKLEGEEYEWAHIAYFLWPERVRKVCETDRSIAIAHGLEHLYKGETKPASKKRGRKKAQAEDVGEELDLGLDEVTNE